MTAVIVLGIAVGAFLILRAIRDFGDCADAFDISLDAADMTPTNDKGEL